jgi:hypothetical protein
MPELHFSRIGLRGLQNFLSLYCLLIIKSPISVDPSPLLLLLRKGSRNENVE